MSVVPKTYQAETRDAEKLDPPNRILRNPEAKKTEGKQETLGLDPEENHERSRRIRTEFCS